MEYFVEQADSYIAASMKVRNKYGERAKIMHQRSIPVRGLFGLFKRNQVEVTGYLATKPTSRTVDLDEEKRKLLNAVRQPERAGVDMETVLQEIKKLSERMSEQTAPDNLEHPRIAELRQILERNDFSQDYVERLISRALAEFSLQALEDTDCVHRQVLQWIGEGIMPGRIERKRKPEIIILVGPTGVGKTTTIAKLAKRFAIDERGKKQADLVMITIDNYRIAAREQIETYGRIMDIPVDSAEGVEDMRRLMAIHKEADYILIDTIGKSPRDARRLGEMSELLTTVGTQRHTVLVMAASTKPADLLTIMRQYEPFDYRSVIVTKLDETNTIGNVLSALVVRPKPILFYTDGQGVPNDIEAATVSRTLRRIDGFSVDFASEVEATKKDAATEKEISHG